jgi:N-acetylmuramic acid 6-phosphate etherase
MTDGFMLDVLTDTTERAPTFRLPPFRKCDDTVSARSWAFLKNPLHKTKAAWLGLLGRPPRGLDWTAETYRGLNAPEILQHNPPRLDNGEIYKFQIGKEIDPSRYQTEDSALAMILVGDEVEAFAAAGHAFQRTFREHAEFFKRTAAICIGPRASSPEVGHIYHIPCELPASPLRLWERLAVKLSFNTISTATMVGMGRVVGNWMTYVEAGNKKLIDRGVRLIAELAGVEYDEACYALFEAMDAVAAWDKRARDVPSPVALAIERLGLKESG